MIMSGKIKPKRGQPRGAAKEKDKDFYDATWDGEVSDEVMETPHEPEHKSRTEEAEKLDSAESDEDYKAAPPKNSHSHAAPGSKITGPVSMDKFKDYLAVLKRHKDCIDAPAAAILWIVDNGTVTRSKYQIPKTHHNPPRSDRERGGYAEILRSLGWKSNYANDGHYDWWMKPDEFDIVSFKEAVNTLRSTPAPASPTHPSPHSSASHHSSVAGAPAQHTETTVRQRQKRERDRPVDVKRGGRPHRTKVVKEEDGVTPEEKPVVKRQRTLLSEFVTVDEKIEDLENKYHNKKKESEECNIELEKIKKSIKELQTKEKELTERRDRCGDAAKKLRTGLRIFKVRDTLLKMGDEGDQARREVVEAERLQFTKNLAEEKKSLKSFLAAQSVRLEATGDTSAIASFEKACDRLRDATQDHFETVDALKVLEWMNARALQAKQGVLHKLYQSFVDDVLQQRRDMPHVSLTVSTKRADESLRKVAEMEVRVRQNIGQTDRTEETEKELQAAIKARDHQREDCIAHISFLLAGPLREALEDISPTKHADFVKLQTYYIAKLRSSQAIKFEAEHLPMLYEFSSNDECYHVRERLSKFQHNFPEVVHYLNLAAVGNLPSNAIHLRRVGSSGHIVVVGTKPFFLKALKDPSTVPNWPPQWLVDIEHISYILPIVGIREYEGRTYIQTPLQHCNLRTWLENPDNRTQKNIQRIFAQLLFTLDWLGEYGQFLGGIKPENVFVSSGNAVIDIFDKYKIGSIFHTCDHRNEYAPVEDNHITYSTHAYDMWSSAMMLYETCFKRPPPHTPIQREHALQTPLAFEADAKFREWLADLLFSITSGFDGEHLTSHEALGHPFFASLFPSSPLSEARLRLAELSIKRTRTDGVGQVARTHIVPSIINAFADVEKRRRAAFARWDVYVTHNQTPQTPNQPFTRELLALYFREVFTHGQLFVSSDTGRYLPNSSCIDSTPFVVLGYLTAKAALTGTPIQCQLAHSVFRYILQDYKDVLYSDLTQALADLYTFDTCLARQYKLNCIHPLQHHIVDDNGHAVTDENKERYFLNEINKKLLIDPKKQLEWIKQGFKEVAPVWDVVAKLDPTALARVVCGRHWVDEGFLKQQLVFDPRVFFPPSLSACAPAVPPPLPTPHHQDLAHLPLETPKAPTIDIDAVPTSTDPPSVLPSLAPPPVAPPSPTSDGVSSTAAPPTIIIPIPTPTTPIPIPGPSLTTIPLLNYTTVTYLHRVLDEWADARDRDKLAKFIYLCTNCVYIPWGGLGDGVFVVLSEDGQPHPHGCCNMIHLPEKESYEAFREMMEEIVRSVDNWIYQLV